MKVSANILAAVAVSTAVVQSVSGCGVLSGCFLRDIKETKETGKDVEHKLTAGDNQFDYLKGSSEYSIRCDVDGHVAEVEFGFEPEGTKHRSWGAPFWISGSWGDWVEPSPWLQFCGSKTLSVKAKTWTRHCFAESYKIVMNCGETTPSLRKPIAPSQAPPETTTTKQPAKAPELSTPAKSPADGPIKAPTSTPIKAPTNAPIKAPTNAPIKAPTNAPIRGPTNTPTDVPVASPTEAPTSVPTGSPTKAPTGSPTIPPTKAPTVTPTEAPTVTMTPAPTARPADSDIECNGKPLFFKEKPCLSGLLSNFRLDKDCSATNIKANLKTVFRNAKRTGIWGHNRRNLGTANIFANNYFPKIFTKGNADEESTDCPWDFNYELQLLTGTLSREKAETVLEKICSIADADSVRNIGTTQWTDIDRRLTPAFMDEYTDGGTDLNHQIGNFQNEDKNTDPRLNKYYPTDTFSYTMGLSVDKYYRNGARSTKLEAVDHLDNCDAQTIMCCFGNDRQYDDNNGNCQEKNCDDAKPADNTDICYAGGRRYQGVDETAHCHGFAWDQDAFDPSNVLRFNSFFYVLMHDHMYSRGYVKSVKPNTLMCSCLEKMPVVSRSDCSELDLESTYLLSVSDGGNINVAVDRLSFEWNACEGYQPGTKRAKNNDLLGRTEKLYQEGKMDLTTRRKVSKTLVENCAAAGYRD